MIMLAGAGIHQLYLERKYPTPREWSFGSRWVLRSAMTREFEPFSRIDGVIVDWARVGSYYKLLLERLEDPKIDGQNLMEQDEGGILVDGVGRTGFDISMKPESWGRGYHQALMGAARSAEHLDGYVTDRKRKKVFPKEMMIGPSNPRPKPKPHGWQDPPKEEDCDPAYASPQVFYMRILTTKGFSTRQRLDAALAYADWLDFKGLAETAESMYDWALDIAAGALPMGSKNVVDMKTGVINPTAEAPASENLLKASTALGVHHALHNNVQTALPIFLSVLKARKDLPPDPLSHARPKELSKPKEESVISAYLRAIKDWLVEAPYPASPPSGDEPPFHTLEEACEEVGLMTYIGEILYATSSKEKGLSWTRDAVEAAEAIMWMMKEEDRKDGGERCQECLETGLNNWKKMARSMAKEAEKKENKNGSKSSGWLNFGREDAAVQSRRWEEELTQIDLRIQKTIPLVKPLEPARSSWLSV
ncbi:hypothetical protein EPUS_04975 [Endocarpon pusillum Z07020]|uniref:Uncharacterized protein n=1 Tax=Endocarpon pusillum (strain Z07020 / HMAS-L-300199) TaxID=1263415 RepID=U1G429_ENDPU|nr:uncharacterized protein EPUS_04975 [Endocarpon pusillum Z07020]ERF72057.1 hypothetical protein EPUS_04975 [Endocarpon pusillum Z07020]